MSARPYPKILRTTEAADATLRTYARGAHLAPFEALILAIGLLRTKDEREAASERAYKFAALWHDLARAMWRRWQNACDLHDTMRDDLAAERAVSADLRRTVASAREATRRADAEVEQLRSQVAGLGRTVDAYSAKVASLKSELAASQARERQADEGAMDARVEAPAPCAPRNKWRRVVSPDLAARVDARIDARPGRDFVFVLENGCSRLEASDDYQDRQKAAKRAAKGA